MKICHNHRNRKLEIKTNRPISKYEVKAEQIESIADKLLADKEAADKPQLKIVKSESVSKSKKTKK